MADIPFSSVSGVGGVTVDRSITAHQVIPSGASGTIISLTPPSGQRVKLEYLQRFSAGSELNVSISIGGSDIITNGELGDSTGSVVAGRFYIGARNPSAGGSPSGSTSPIIGGVDETLSVIKTSGTTSSDIVYSYRFTEE